ncbi:hypothetical protein BJ742DRAFT_854018, partial [Cladochytrium replicatum]
MDPEQQTVSELAKQAPQRETKHGLFPGIPFLFAMPALFLFGMAAGIAPSLVTVLGTAQDSINDMTTQIILSASLSAASSVVQMLKEVDTVTAIVTNDPTVMDFITTQVYNYGNNPKLTLVFDNINNQSVTNSLGCSQNQGLVKKVEGYVPPLSLNTTNFKIQQFGSRPEICWSDYNSPSVWCTLFDRKTGQNYGQAYKDTSVPDPYYWTYGN